MIGFVKRVLRFFNIFDKFKSNKYMKIIIKKYNKYLSAKKSKIFKKYGLECLARTRTALNNAGIPFWLDYGTLLGAIREKDFIEHDCDLDIGIFYKDRNDSIEKEMVKNGLIKNREFLYEQKVLLETYSYNGVDIDFFYYFIDEDRVWSYTFNGDECIKIEKYDKKSFISGYKTFMVDFRKFELSEMYFKGSVYGMPQNPGEYLAQIYGDNYMVKDKEWNVFKMKNLSKTLLDGLVCIQYI